MSYEQRIKKVSTIIDNYKNVVFHLKDGSLYRADNLAKFKKMVESLGKEV